MNKLKIPFSGFYHTNHGQMIDDALEQACHNDDGEVDTDKLNELHESTDWQDVRVSYAKEYTEALESAMQDVNLSLDIEFRELQSPREYNFSNDEIMVNIHDQDIELIFRMVTMLHGVALREHVKKELEPRDGFVPFYSNNFDEWLTDANYQPLVMDAPQLELILEVFITQFCDFNESTVSDDWNCNGDIDGWIYAAMKPKVLPPEPEPERTFDVNLNAFANTTNMRDAIKQCVMTFAQPNLINSVFDVVESHNETQVTFADALNVPLVNYPSLNRALADSTRYIELIGMKVISDSEAVNVETLQHGTKPDYYDIMVRGDHEEDWELEDVVYYEAENVAPEDAETVRQVLEHTFKLNELADTNTQYVIQGRREGDDDDVVIIEAASMPEAVEIFVRDILDQEGGERNEDYFIIGAASLTDFLSTKKLEVQ